MSEGSNRLQFTTKSFLLDTSFIGAGVGCYAAGFLFFLGPGSLDDSSVVWWPSILAFLQILVGGPLIGAGLLAPFHRMRLGLYAGFFVAIIAAIANFGWPAVWHEQPFVVAFTLMAIAVAAFSILRRAWTTWGRRTTPKNLGLD